MKLQAVDIGKTSSAATIVFEALRQAIVDGDLKDGQSLRQDEIAKLFNTSRIPVREALTRLEQYGLVTTKRYHGAVVAKLSAAEAMEIFDLRALVEGAVITAAVPLMNDTILQEAREHLEAFSKSSDPMEWGKFNRKFHSTLYQVSQMPYHLSVIDNALDRVDRYLRAQLTFSNGFERANEEHEQILAACKAKKTRQAAVLTRRHIRGAKETLLKYL